MELDAQALQEWQLLESRRLEGEPVAYLIGKKGFHNIELQVAPGVLIPRPETELLVDIALDEIQKIDQATGSPRILDLGTGSGAIALAIAHEAPYAQVIATDRSSKALSIASLNAKSLGIEARVECIQGNWYEALRGDAIFDVILSNPPYIANQDSHLFQGDLRFEPIDALTDHGSGLSCLKEIIQSAPKYLKGNGLIAVEHGYDQSNAVAELMNKAGLREIQVHQDLSGHDRAVSARK
jgi:release factor glutamine methyltransferase